MKHKKGFSDQQILYLKDLSSDSLWRKFEGVEKFAVIGNPISKSLSYLTHNETFRAFNLNAQFFRVHLEEHELLLGITRLLKVGVHGIAVTMPFKEDVLSYLDELTPLAKSCGSVNTLILKNERLLGDNTDGLAVERLLLPHIREGSRAILFGAGGTAKAIAYILWKNQIPFTVCNRSLKPAKALADRYQMKAISLENWEEALTEKDNIFIQATSVGMAPDKNASIVDSSRFPSGSVVLDVVYQPVETQFILQAQKAQCEVIYGLDMFLHQALLQFHFFLNQPLPYAKVSPVFRRHLSPEVVLK